MRKRAASLDNLEKENTVPMPYAHLALSQRCLGSLDVDDLNDYYLGAFMPDIRYFTKQPRAMYHFSLEKADELARDGAVSEAFVLGYKTHLLLDQFWGKSELKQQYQAAFPFFLRRRMSPRILEVALEIYCLNQDPIKVRLTAAENSMTQALGISGDILAYAVSLLQDYIDRRSLRAGLDIAESTGMYPPGRLTEMRRLSKVIESNRVVRFAVYRIVNRSSRHTYTRLIDGVLAQLRTTH
jgi:hypothetical protein